MSINNSNKRTLALAALLVAMVALVGQANASACMMCKHLDTVSGFMYDYSYCKNTMKCFDAIWNHPNAWCEDPWLIGYNIDLVEDCGANVTYCQDFTSSDVFQSKNETGTRRLN